MALDEIKVKIIGAGLAGCEAAWQLAEAGVNVQLFEMKPLFYTPAHKYKGFAELVCSNSLKAARLDSAAGLLKEEMRMLGSLIIPCAEKTAVAAGGALAVDREAFSDMVTEKICKHPKIQVIEDCVGEIPDGDTIIATGPLTSGGLAEDIVKKYGACLSFYDAAAPIITFDSLDKDLVFFASRYGKGDDDYINCPMNKEEYLGFYNALLLAESAPLHDFDNPENSDDTIKTLQVYEGCMPIEVLASRGEDTMRFGPLKPVGLIDPRTDKRPYAVVQLRKENSQGTLYNIVGFQTNLKFGEQKRVFSKITGLTDVEFVRYGVMHRNSFIDSPRLLNQDFSLRSNPRLYFCGQITGVEGYIESAASGILAGKNLAHRLAGQPPISLPRDTMLGALTSYISDEYVKNFQPMGCNMGILPPLDVKIKDKKLRYMAMAERAVSSLKNVLDGEVNEDNS